MPSTPPTDAPQRRPITLLSPTVASQIAAGEVIERPSSVVKELVENALDAGARSVSVELERGGLELIRVTDDGTGIPAAELPLAVTAHATSKIRTSQDLDRIATMGFRGEALASIASVARLTIRSRAAGAGAGAVLTVDAGEVGAVEPASARVGTAIEVRAIFHATPARRKFLKTPQTERGRCLNVLKDLAIANPAVGFSVVSDGRTTLSLEPEQAPRERVLDVLGRELEPQLLEAHADDFDDARGIALWGLVGLPEIARPTSQWQHVFVNGRPVRDRSIQHALKEAYRGLMEHSRFPTAVLLLEMSPEAVDVNVHPAKAEVRFRTPGHVHSVVHRAVSEALRRRDLTPEVQSGFRAPAAGPGGVGSAGAGGFLEFFSRTVPAATGGRLSFDALRDAMERPAADEPPVGAASDSAATVEEPAASETAASELPELKPSPTLQVHNSYIVTQDDDGVVIVDQHALHERVMFEYLMGRLERGPLESQALLAPVPVELDAARMEAADAMAGLFERIGIELTPLGPDAVGIGAFPSFLFDRGVDPGVFLTELLDASASSPHPPTSEEALHTVVDMMSCKAAVKAGDKLRGDELESLLALRESVERSSSCPHGRPTSVRLTLRQLEKLFHRA